MNKQIEACIEEAGANDWEVLLLPKKFDDAFVGMASQPCGELLAVYDSDKCIKVLMKKDKMRYDEALDHFEFNVSGGYVGEKTPMFITLKPRRKR